MITWRLYVDNDRKNASFWVCEKSDGVRAMMMILDADWDASNQRRGVTKGSDSSASALSGDLPSPKVYMVSNLLVTWTNLPFGSDVS